MNTTILFSNYEQAVMEHKKSGKRELLLYLLEVAQKTEGAEVWRALFSEMISSLDKE